MAKGKYIPQKGVHLSKEKPISYQAELDQRTPVLLHEGFPAIAAGSGDRVSNTFQVATNRGQVKYIDLFPFFRTQVNFDDNVPFTLDAGGQVLIQDTNLGIWDVSTQLGMDKRQRVRVNLNDAQTFTATLDNTDGSLIQVIFAEMYYSTPSYENYIKNIFRLKWGLGFKRRTYRLEVPTGSLGDITFRQETLSRSQGSIIAVGVHTNTDLSSLLFFDYSISVDGIEIIKNVTAFNAATASGRDSYLMPVPIRGGAEVKLSSSQHVAGGINDVVLYFTFFFSN